MMFNFDNTFVELPERLYARVQPRRPTKPRAVIRNHGLAQELGIDVDAFSGPNGIEALSGDRIPEGAAPLAMAYGGHQFGFWVPSLGDGRALLLGEILDRQGSRRDVQLKGSGRTPFSRQGDGRAWLGPAIREYIVSEAMHHLGIPSTRALAVMETGDPVYRETALPGAVLTRVARAHIRIGTFQYFLARRDVEAIRCLADHVIARLYPDLRESSQPYVKLLRVVVKGQAQLVAQWMGVGFIHGVMNTDNMSLACETIDFGPCAFMDRFSSAKVFSSIDKQGRYAYCNQPAIAQWNLAQLAVGLLPIMDDDEDRAVQLAEEAIRQFPKDFEDAHRTILCSKLGLYHRCAEDYALANAFLDTLERAKADFTLAFRTLCSDSARSLGTDSFAAFSSHPEAFRDWLSVWQSRLTRERIEDFQRGKRMRRINPVYIARNHQVQKAIDLAVGGDYELVHRLGKVLANPCIRQKGAEDLELTPLPHEVVHRTFCGT